MSEAGILWPRLSRMAESAYVGHPPRHGWPRKRSLDSPVTPGAPKTPAGRLRGTTPRVASKARRSLLPSLPRSPGLASTAARSPGEPRVPVLSAYKSGLEPEDQEASPLTAFKSAIKKRQASLQKTPGAVGWKLELRPRRPPIPHPPGLTGPSPHSPSIPAAVPVTRITRHGVNGCGVRERPSEGESSSDESRRGGLGDGEAFAGASPAEGNGGDEAGAVNPGTDGNE